MNQTKAETLSVAHLWDNFYLNADGNPQHYLKKHKHISITIAATLLDKGSEIPSDVFYYKKLSLDSLTSKSIINRVINKLMRPIFWYQFNNWSLKLIREKKPQIVHAHFGQTAVRILPLIKKTKLPLVVTYYGVDGSSLVNDPYWAKAYKEMFGYASKVIVLSEVVKERLHGLGCPLDKIKVWNIPIKLDTYQYKERTQKETYKFITAARFVEKKGYPFLLAAFKKVHSQYANTTLTIIGYGQGKDQIEADVLRLDLQDSVTIIDTKLRMDFAEFYYSELCTHDIFVLPSTTSKNGDDEGGPSLTLVAAQAAGLPVICTPFPGSEISVFHEKTGLICIADNVESIADNMIYLMLNSHLWNEYGKVGSDFVHLNFSEECQMNKLLEEYQKIVE
jgi:colanic acid/amylovoran biosynthesis glycosyltransferase